MAVQKIRINLTPEQLRKMDDYSVYGVEIQNRKICLVKLPGGFFAIDDKCPHAGARLSHGKCDDKGFVVCAFHRYRYDAVTGKGLQGDFVNTYPVEETDDGLYISIRKWLGLF